MRKITEKNITDTVSRLCLDSNIYLRKDVEKALIRAFEKENNKQARKILQQLFENAKIAKSEHIPLCQDTGLPIVFVDIGRGVDITGLDMVRAINKGVREGYHRGYLRNSIVRDPLRRGLLSGFTPCVIHFDLSRHKGLRLTVLPKGFGCENKTKLIMLYPTATMDEIKKCIISAVTEAGPDACPPYILGIGIGGSADYACQLSKKAFLRPIYKRSRLKHVARLEEELLKDANKLNIGPMGLGGKTTVLGVNILVYPTHIAGLPICVNISCHVLRSASALLS
ncbi:MAG: fumarate hydratase [Candidatus Omnitrophota bacterium]